MRDKRGGDLNILHINDINYKFSFKKKEDFLFFKAPIKEKLKRDKAE